MADSSTLAQTHQNPLSKKLQKILQNNLDDDKDTLEALQVLSSFLEENTLQVRIARDVYVLPSCQ